MALADINDGGTPHVGISSRRARPCTHRPEREREQEDSVAINALHPAARDSLGKVSKSVFLVVRES